MKIRFLLNEPRQPIFYFILQHKSAFALDQRLRGVVDSTSVRSLQSRYDLRQGGVNEWDNRDRFRHHLDVSH